MKQLKKPASRTPAMRWKNTKVRQLCERLQITGLADLAIELVQKRLKPKRMRIEPGSDPEGDGEWLVIRADVRGSVAEVLDNYAACKKEWLELAPPSKQRLVRFLYNIR